MDSWPAPEVPRLPANGPEVGVFNSATGQVEPSVPASGEARLYVCGITPYDTTHMGHAATYVAFDLLNRAWRSAGHQVHYVQNNTDVDDPLLERARDTGVDWRDLAERETQRFRDDMAALRVLPPRNYIGAVESIPLVVAMIEDLRARGSVYDVDGDCYFSVHSDPRFGSVSGLEPGAMVTTFCERGGDPERPGKKDPLDCLLWQAARPGEPAWDSPFGSGRPGWHIECSAIAREFLGGAFDVQGGGSDLIFPHHEMSAAEAQVVHPEQPFACSYVHAGMVGLDGEKMSKSKGNLVLVSRLREGGLDPMMIRLVLLGHHYRSDWEWQESDLSAAGARLEKLRYVTALPAGAPTEAVIGEVLAALADDLRSPDALRAVDHWADATEFGAADEPGAGARIAAVLDAALGIAL